MGNSMLLLNWDAVSSMIARAHDMGRILTNCYLDPDRVAEWCASGTVFGEEVGGVTAIWRDMRSFCMLFFLAETREALFKYVAGGLNAPRNSVVVDLVGPDNIRLPLVSVFESAGFGHISELVRMSRKTPKCTGVPTGVVSVSNVQDIPDLQSIFQTHFNPEVEQLPSDTELERWIAKGGVLVQRDEHGRVQSFIIYDLNKASLYLRYWFVNPQMRNCGVGGHLMRAMFFYAKETKRQYFWVISNNENAIRRYEHYGFKAEPMKDTVMRRNI